jgi:cell wall-associated NlpC family hydrolase
MRNDVVEEARNWIGTRWRHQGRNEYGIDCAGLIIVVASKFGLQDTNPVNYPRRTNGDMFVTYFEAAGMVRIPYEDRLPGDVILTQDHGLPCHCGFLSMKHGVEHYLHGYALRRKVVEEPFDPYWKDRMTHVMRFPKIEET